MKTESSEVKTQILGDYAAEFLEENSKILSKIDEQSLNDAIILLDEARQNGNSVFVIGNGGSASTASHLASDLFKWASGNGARRMKVYSLVDNVPTLTALTNDDGWENVYIEQLKTHASKGDVIIAFSVHGGKGTENSGVWSQNLTKAIQYVHDVGGLSLGITGFDGGAMKELCTVHVNVPAESTPIVEGTHVVLSHLIADGLRQIALPPEEREKVRK